MARVLTFGTASSSGESSLSSMLAGLSCSSSSLTGMGAREGGASVGGGDRVISSSSCSTIGGEEVRVVTTLLAIGIFLGIFRSASTLGACRNAFVGVTSLVDTGARNMVALRDAAGVLGVT